MLSEERAVWDQFGTAATALTDEHGQRGAGAMSALVRDERTCWRGPSDLRVERNEPRRRRDGILTELRDGLEQATEDRIRTGQHRSGRRSSDQPVAQRRRRRVRRELVIASRAASSPLAAGLLQLLHAARSTPPACPTALVAAIATR